MSHLRVRVLPILSRTSSPRLMSFVPSLSTPRSLLSLCTVGTYQYQSWNRPLSFGNLIPGITYAHATNAARSLGIGRGTEGIQLFKCLQQFVVAVYGDSVERNEHGEVSVRDQSGITFLEQKYQN